MQHCRLYQPEAHQAQRTTTLTSSAQKATRSHWGSPQYYMITRRRSSWPASSGSTAAECSSPARERQARSWEPSWAELLLTPRHLAVRDCTERWLVEGTGA